MESSKGRLKAVNSPVAWAFWIEGWQDRVQEHFLAAISLHSEPLIAIAICALHIFSIARASVTSVLVVVDEMTALGRISAFILSRILTRA